MFRHFLLICLFAAAFQINAFAIETLETHYTPRRETADLAQYSPSEMKRIRRAIVAFQTELKRIGYYKGPIDGLYGKGTNAAWVRFARENGLSTKRLGNYEYEILRNYHSEHARGRDAKALAIEQARQLFGYEAAMDIKKYLQTNCKLPKTPNDWRDVLHVLKEIEQENLKCLSQLEIAQKIIDKNTTQQAQYRLKILKINEPNANGSADYAYCLNVTGRVNKGFTETILNIFSKPIPLYIDTLCLDFSGGDVLEGLKFLALGTEVKHKLLKVEEPLGRTSLRTRILPNQTCGDVCSMIFLSGRAVEHYAWPDRKLSRQGKLIFHKYVPNIDRRQIDKSVFQDAFSKIAIINSELLRLSQVKIDSSSFVTGPESYIFPPSLLDAINRLPDGQGLTVPTSPLHDGNHLTDINIYGIGVY